MGEGKGKDPRCSISQGETQGLACCAQASRRGHSVRPVPDRLLAAQEQAGHLRHSQGAQASSGRKDPAQTLRLRVRGALRDGIGGPHVRRRCRSFKYPQGQPTQRRMKKEPVLRDTDPAARESSGVTHGEPLVGVGSASQKPNVMTTDRHPW